MAYSQTPENETARLEQIQASSVVGICYLDEAGRLVQYFDSDPALKDAIVDYQRERIQELELVERKTLKQASSSALIKRQGIKVD